MRSPATLGKGHKHAMCLSYSIQIMGLTRSQNQLGVPSPCQGGCQLRGASGK